LDIIAIAQLDIQEHFVTDYLHIVQVLHAKMADLVLKDRQVDMLAIVCQVTLDLIVVLPLICKRLKKKYTNYLKIKYFGYKIILFN